MQKYNSDGHSHNDDSENKKNKKNFKRVFKDYEIFSGKIRLVRDGMKPEIIDRDEAIEIAKSEGKNLIQIAYNKNDFPRSICKIVDYSKFLYDQKKREKEARKQAKASQQELKEVQFSIRIDDGDFNTKCNHIREFLSDKMKVQISIRLLRRELSLKDYAIDTMKKIFSKIEDISELDQKPSLNGTVFSCIVRPKK